MSRYMTGKRLFACSGEVSTRLIVALAVVGVLAAAAVPLGFYLYPAIVKLFEEPPPQVGVVGTAEDLKALRPFELPGGGSARLGISSDECYLGGCIMVYCLAEGNLSVINENPVGRYELGPLTYYVYRKDKPRSRPLQRLVQGPAGEIAGFHYNTAFAPLEAKGSRYIIKFYDWEDNTIANVSFTAHRPAPHPWQDFQYERLWDSSLVITGICNRSMAVPHSDSSVPPQEIPTVLPKVPFDSRTGETGDLKLARIGKGFRLSSDRPFNRPFTRKLLGRFWINDRPVKANPKIKPIFYKLSGRLYSVPGLYFELNLDYKESGIKPGDTIKMQFLYAQFWEYVYGGKRSGLQHFPLYGDSEIRISNTLEFTCP